MNTINLLRSELRKLATTRMPLAFGIVLAAIAAMNGVAVVAGHDMDGSKTFISTATDQQSLIAFAVNALLLAGFFGAIAAAREYANSTVIATYLVTPHRRRALRAQFTAIGIGGAVLGIVGAALTATSLALTLPFTEYGFMVPIGGVARVVAASALAGACGAVVGATIGTLVRNVGGAVTGAVLVLIVAPPIVVQLANGTGTWMLASLVNVVSGVAVDGSGVLAAVMAIGAWAVVPALAASWSVEHRDVV